jgi:hypothetical protein
MIKLWNKNCRKVNSSWVKDYTRLILRTGGQPRVCMWICKNARTKCLKWFGPPERNTLHTLCVVLLRVKINLDLIGPERACPFVSHVPSFLLCIMCCQSVWHRIKMLIWIPRQAKKKRWALGTFSILIINCQNFN